jgi:hypothetical protein
MAMGDRITPTVQKAGAKVKQAGDKVGDATKDALST